MSSTETDLQETQDLLESLNFQDVNFLESLNFQEEIYGPQEPHSLLDDLQNESFDLNKENKDPEDPLDLSDDQYLPLLKTENDDLLQSFIKEEHMNKSYSLQKPTTLQNNIQNPADLFEAAWDLQDPLRLNTDPPSPKEEGPDSLEWELQNNIQDPADLFEAQLDLQDPLRLNTNPPSPKEEGPDSLEWDHLIEPSSISHSDLKDTVIIKKDINKLTSVKKDQDLHGFEWDHLDDSVTLQSENIQQPFSQQYILQEKSILTDRDTHDALSLQESGSSYYSSPCDLSKFTLGLNEDDNGPKEYYGPERPDSETYASLNTSLTPKILHKSNKLEKFNHYLVEFDDNEVVVEKCNTLNNNEENSESSQIQKRKSERKRKSLSRKAKMYVTSNIFIKGQNQNDPKLLSKNTIPDIVEISKSSENPKRTKVVIKGLEKMKKSDVIGVLGHLSNYITDNAISTALNEHRYFKKSKAIHANDFSNLSYSNVQSNILRQLALQASLLTLNEILDQGVLDITNHATIQLGQILTFSIYFQKNIRKLAHAAWQSQPVVTLTGAVQEIAHEVPAHLALGTSLVALTDQIEVATLDETWVGLGCLGLTYLYHVARKNRRIKDAKQKVKQ